MTKKTYLGLPVTKYSKPIKLIEPNIVISVSYYSSGGLHYKRELTFVNSELAKQYIDRLTPNHTLLKLTIS